MRTLRNTLWLVAASQLMFGLMFVLIPRAAAHGFGLTPVEPGWADWLFVMMGARFLAFAYGLVLAARDPLRHESWINAMIVVQVIDWVTTLAHLSVHHIALPNVASAVVLPVLIVAALLRWHPRRVLRAAPDVPSPVPAGR